MVNLNLTNDFDVFDNQIQVILHEAGTLEVRRIPKVLQTLVSTRAVDSLGNVYTKKVTAFSIPTHDVITFPPQIGGVIESPNGTLWAIEAVQLATFRARYRCECAFGVLTSGLSELFTVEFSTWMKDGDGFPYPSWSVLESSVKGTVQEVESEIIVELERRRRKVSHRIYLDSSQDFKAGMRIMDESGNAYLVLRVTGKGGTGVPVTIEVESQSTPASS